MRKKTMETKCTLLVACAVMLAAVLAFGLSGCGTASDTQESSTSQTTSSSSSAASSSTAQLNIDLEHYKGLWSTSAGDEKIRLKDKGKLVYTVNGINPTAGTWEKNDYGFTVSVDGEKSEFSIVNKKTVQRQSDQVKFTYVLRPEHLVYPESFVGTWKAHTGDLTGKASYKLAKDGTASYFESGKLIATGTWEADRNSEVTTSFGDGSAVASDTLVATSQNTIKSKNDKTVYTRE